MASIHPFRGVRYNQGKVGSLDDVVTPPYDVISPDEQTWYFGKHPNSVIRLILPKESPANGATPTKYDRAANCLHEWLESGVLARDEEPSFYAIEQEYVVDGQMKKRLGFTCLVRIEDYDKKTVLPHENTLAKPLDDRLNLIRATRSNFDSVFGLYSGLDVDGLLRPYLLREPDSKATDKEGVVCSLWKISDPATIEAIVSKLSDQPVLIADGHHRYAAALAYRNEMRAKAGDADPNAPYEFVMMTLVSLEDSGLVILPTHRLIKNLPDFDAGTFLAKLEDYFDVTVVPADELVQAVESKSDEHAFGLYMGDGKSYVIVLKPSVKPEKEIDTPVSDALKRLDVSILHSMILEKFLGIGAQQMSAQSNLAYKRDPQEALKAVDSGEFQIAFILNSTKVQEVKDVAAAGDRMPQKSTFFYPKLLTGQLMRVME